MHDPLHQQRFTQLLYQSSQRLDELISSIHGYDPQQIPLELLDEIASTIGELMLIMTDHLAIHHNQEFAHQLVSHAQRLRHDVRSQELPKDQIALAVSALSEELNEMIRIDKRAA